MVAGTPREGWQGGDSPGWTQAGRKWLGGPPRVARGNCIEQGQAPNSFTRCSARVVGVSGIERIYLRKTRAYQLTYHRAAREYADSCSPRAGSSAKG